MKCDMCESTALLNVQWGLYEPNNQKRTKPMFEGNFCDDHAEQLWSRVKGAVNMQLMHWTNTRIPRDEPAQVR